MPRDLHGLIITHLLLRLGPYLKARHPSPALHGPVMYVRCGRRSREPDIAVLFDRDDPRRGPEEWDGADVVMEVVSPDDPDRDHDAKREDYAAAGVPEYWIVDPRERTREDPRGRTVRVLTLDGGAYREAVFEDGETAAGPALPGFAVDVAACLAGSP